MSNHRRYIILSTAYVLAIYTTSGQMRDLSSLIRQFVGDALNVLMTVGLTLILAGILLVFRHALSRRHILPLLPILLGYGFGLWWLTIPEERFHLLQYGLLCVLCNKTLSDQFQGLPRHGLVILLVTLAGIGDELIQWLRPNRVGDVRDVLINFVAALLAQALIAIVNRGHKGEGRRSTPDERTTDC